MTPFQRIGVCWCELAAQTEARLSRFGFRIFVRKPRLEQSVWPPQLIEIPIDLILRLGVASPWNAFFSSSILLIRRCGTGPTLWWWGVVSRA